MIKVEHIYKKFGNNIVFNNLNYQFEDKTFYILTGENGSGKSCLLYILGLIDTKFSGKIYFKDKQILFSSRHLVGKKRKGISFLMPKGNLISYLSCKDNLMLGVHNKIINLCPELNLNQDIKSLSGGEELLLALSRDISLKKDIYLLDEVTSSLDDKHVEQITNALQELSKEKLIIMASHDQRVFNIGKRLILKDGLLKDY